MQRSTHRFAATVNLLMLAFLVPAVLWNNVFKLAPAQAPGSRLVLGVALVAVWAALALRPWATPSGKVWPLPMRMLFFAGGHLAMIAVMWTIHGMR